MASGTTVDKLILEIQAETAQLRRDLQKVQGQLDKTTKTSKGLQLSLGKVATAFVALGGVALVKNIVDTTRKFEDLKATIEAITGSADTANLAFDVIKDFTATTTFQLDGVTQAFITLLQAGITPTADTLQDFGNLAAAFDKDISTIAQATFRAMTGEMEMLKQFNVIMKVEGDKFKATFNGITQTVDRNGVAISEYLRGLARENFPDALEKRANTLTGAISNLEDAFSIFQSQVGDEFRPVLIQIARDMATFFQESEDGAKVIGEVLADSFRFLAATMKFVTNNADVLKGAIIGLTAAAVVNGIITLVNTFIRLSRALKSASTASAVLFAIQSRGLGLLALGGIIGAATVAVDNMLSDTVDLSDALEDIESDTDKAARQNRELADSLIRAKDATQLFGKEGMHLITTLRGLTGVSGKLDLTLNRLFGFDAKNRVAQFNNELDKMRKTFQDQRLSEILAGKSAGFVDITAENTAGMVAPGDSGKHPLDLLSDITASFSSTPHMPTMQDFLDTLNASDMGSLFPGFAHIKVYQKEVEENGKMVPKIFVRGIKDGMVNDLLGDDVFAQFLGFESYADMQNFAENFLPVGNVQTAVTQLQKGIQDGIGGDLLGNMGFSDQDPFAELKFLVDPNNITNLQAFKTAMQEGGLLPPGLGDDAASLALFASFLQEIIDKGTQAAIELTPLEQRLYDLAHAAKFPETAFEDLADAILNDEADLSEYFENINAKFPDLFANYEEFVAMVKSGALQEGLGDAVTFSDEMLQTMTSATQQFTSQFVDALMTGADALDAFEDLAKNIVKQIIATFIQMAIVNQILNSVFGLTGSNALPTIDFNAGGGRVQAGRPTVVGERGAELFVPDSSGKIMNHHDSSMYGGAGTTVVNQSINFATGVVPTVRAEVTKMLPQIAEVTKGAVADASMRGGNFRRMLKGNA